MASATENNVNEKVRDFIAERELQRLGTDEIHVFNRHGKMLGKMAELGAAHPDAEPDKLERMAVGDCLFNLEVESNKIRLYAESIERYLDEYIEELGLDVPHELEHIQLNLWHLADDCRRFCEDYESVRAWACTLIERHPA